MDNRQLLDNNLMGKDWFIEVYPEWNAMFQTSDLLVKHILQNIEYTYYALIYHDKDMFEDGTLKKPHYHIYLKLSKKERPSYLIKKFNMPKNQPQFCQLVQNINGCLNYLIHKNNPEKYQYNISEVVTNISNFNEVIDKGLSDSEILFNLLKRFKEISYDFKTHDIMVSFRDFCDFAYANHALDLCIKYAYFIRTYLGF